MVSDQAHTGQPTASFTHSHTYHTFYTNIYTCIYYEYLRIRRYYIYIYKMIFFIIHHFPYYIVDFRSANWLPYEYWSVANTDTRSAPIFWVARFFLWRLVWTASALDHLLICCSAPNTEDVIISSAFQCCRVRVVRYCVAAELEDFDRDSRTDGLIYMAANLVHFRPLFLEFLRQSKTSL